MQVQVRRAGKLPLGKPRAVPGKQHEGAMRKFRIEVVTKIGSFIENKTGKPIHWHCAWLSLPPFLASFSSVYFLRSLLFYHLTRPVDDGGWSGIIRATLGDLVGLGPGERQCD